MFMGSWQNADGMYRLATILACASIVVTAVYILRAMGKVIMGPLQMNNDTAHPNLLGADAGWNEKAAAAILIIGIVIIGMAPFWLSQVSSTKLVTSMTMVLPSQWPIESP